MNKDESDTGIVAQSARAITDLTKSIPIYQDALQPAAQEVGKSLALVAQAVNAALAPVEGLVWGVDRIRDFLREKLALKLERIPPSRIQQPKSHIAVPAIEALRYTGVESALAELYANLLATSIDRNTAYQAHPAFVDIIKNISPDEARILQTFAMDNDQPAINIRVIVNDDGHFYIPYLHVSLIGIKSGCEHAALTPNYLDNLSRLGLLAIVERHRVSDDLYAELEHHPSVISTISSVKKNYEGTIELDRLTVELTRLGTQFISACVLDKSIKNPTFSGFPRN